MHNLYLLCVPVFIPSVFSVALVSQDSISPDIYCFMVLLCSCCYSFRLSSDSLYSVVNVTVACIQVSRLFVYPSNQILCSARTVAFLFRMNMQVRHRFDDVVMNLSLKVLKQRSWHVPTTRINADAGFTVVASHPC